MSGNGLPIVNLGTNNTFLGWGIFLVLITTAVAVTTLQVGMKKDIEKITESVLELKSIVQKDHEKVLQVSTEIDRIKYILDSIKR